MSFRIFMALTIFTFAYLGVVAFLAAGGKGNKWPQTL